jgi:hypothetical protein
MVWRVKGIRGFPLLVLVFILQIEGVPWCCYKWPLYFEVCYAVTVDKDSFRLGILSSVSSLLIWFSQFGGVQVRDLFSFTLEDSSFPWFGALPSRTFFFPFCWVLLFYWWQVFIIVRVRKIQGMLKPKMIKSMISLKSENSMLCQIPQLWEYIYPFVTVFRFKKRRRLVFGAFFLFM